jgi:hypothetical protein
MSSHARGLGNLSPGRLSESHGDSGAPQRRRGRCAGHHLGLSLFETSHATNLGTLLGSQVTQGDDQEVLDPILFYARTGSIKSSFLGPYIYSSALPFPLLSLSEDSRIGTEDLDITST